MQELFGVLRHTYFALQGALEAFVSQKRRSSESLCDRLHDLARAPPSAFLFLPNLLLCQRAHRSARRQTGRGSLRSRNSAPIAPDRLIYKASNRRVAIYLRKARRVKRELRSTPSRTDAKRSVYFWPCQRSIGKNFLPVVWAQRSDAMAAPTGMRRCAVADLI